MTSDKSGPTTPERGRVRVDLTLPPDLVLALRAYARAWQVPLSLVVEVAIGVYLQEQARRKNQAPIRLRFRQRRGPLSKAELRASDAVMSAMRARGGRPATGSLPAP